MEEDIILAGDFNLMKSNDIGLYCTHALCHEGKARFHMAGQQFKISEGDCVIFTHSELVSDIQVSENFRATVIYLSNRYALKNMPKNDYDVIGKLTLLRNPIIPLTTQERMQFMDDVEQIRKRLDERGHRFHDDLMGCLTEVFRLDLYDFHARIYEQPQVSKQGAILLCKFIDMLKEKEYENHREVSYYASRLFITPKYLSEICKKISGFGANFWINHFTITGITRLLSDKDMPLKTIAERFHFSSLPYFSRYVQNILGVSPTEYRNKM